MQGPGRYKARCGHATCHPQRSALFILTLDVKVTLGSEKIDQVLNFTFLGGIVSKDCGSSEDVKSKITKAQGAFLMVEKKFEKEEDKFANQDKNIGSYSDDSS